MCKINKVNSDASQLELYGNQKILSIARRLSIDLEVRPPADYWRTTMEKAMDESLLSKLAHLILERDDRVPILKIIFKLYEI